MYSPMTEPIHAMPTSIFSVLTNVFMLPGMTSFLRIWNLLAPMERMRSILFLSVARKPLSMLMMVTIMPISTAISTMDLLPLPHHTIMMGPSAIFGRALSTIRYGSKTRLKTSDHHRSRAINVPSTTAITKPRTVSYSVTPIW